MPAKIVRAEELNWILPPGHESSYSKLLLNPENSETQYFDFRVAITRPQGQIFAHKHERAENIYYVIRGEGVIELDGARHVIRPGMCVFIPPGIVHGLFNTGFEDLVTIVVAGPPSDMKR
ncbi:MAG: cupin domain-containing protein [Chloroflexi bacterium]|nr:cupin domain-containing protein [Chloroflexota bacterium]